MGMQVEEWLFFLAKIEEGIVIDQDTESAFNRAFGQRGRGTDRNE